MQTIRRYAWAWWWGMAVVLAAPALASWTVTASNITWEGTGDLALVQEVRAAVLWDRKQKAFMGAIYTAALPNLAVTDNGDGTGTIRIAMDRAPGEAWVADYAVAGCGEGQTTAQILACVDRAIKGDLRNLIQRYRVHLREQSTPVIEPPELEQ